MYRDLYEINHGATMDASMLLSIPSDGSIPIHSIFHYHVQVTNNADLTLTQQNRVELFLPPLEHDDLCGNITSTIQENQWFFETSSIQENQGFVEVKREKQRPPSPLALYLSRSGECSWEERIENVLLLNDYSQDFVAIKYLIIPISPFGPASEIDDILGNNIFNNFAAANDNALIFLSELDLDNIQEPIEYAGTPRYFETPFSNCTFRLFGNENENPRIERTLPPIDKYPVVHDIQITEDSDDDSSFARAGWRGAFSAIGFVVVCGSIIKYFFTSRSSNPIRETGVRTNQGHRRTNLQSDLRAEEVVPTRPRETPKGEVMTEQNFQLLPIIHFQATKFVGNQQIDVESQSDVTLTTTKENDFTSSSDLQSQTETTVVTEKEHGTTGKSMSNREPSCPICIENFINGEELVILPHCCHAYHRNCIKQWLLERQDCCPLCRKKALFLCDPIIF